VKKAALFVLGGAVLLCLGLEAVVPQKWELRTREEFLKGKFDGVSLAADGSLSLAPREEKKNGPAEEFYLSFLPLEDGASFLGTGHGGKIYRIAKDGQPELWFQTAEMDVTCLARDKKGVLYAGTSPNGKIYRVTAKEKGEEFFNPDEKYVWDLLFRDSGTLLAAVGERGGVYEITPQGEGRPLFKADENHILCLVRTPTPEVLAGSGGGGLVYRLSPDGRAFVLFETPYEEVRSLALGADGAIYAAASGTPTKGKKDDLSATTARSDANVTLTVSASGAVPEAAQLSAAPGRAPGAIFRIGPDGVAKRLWQSDEETVYTLLWQAAEKRLLFGTGGQGRLYALDRDENSSLLSQAASEQIYLLKPGADRVHILANNPCSLTALYADRRAAGEYTGPVVDAKTIATWGRIVWEGAAPQGTTIQVQTRSGNEGEPNGTWSDWSPPYQKSEERILSPRARFLQLKVLLKSQTGSSAPVVRNAGLFYLQTNLAPAIARLEFLKPNEVYLKLPDQDDVILGAEKDLADRPTRDEDVKTPTPSKRTTRQGFRTVVWEADDENGDALVFSLALKREDESSWRVIQQGWEEPVFAFDTLGYPDGIYLLRLTAADAPANPEGTEQRAERIGRPFAIDNTAPLIRDFLAVRKGDSLEVSFRAEDTASPLEEAKVLARPSPWRVVFPEDGVCDGRSETFKLTLKIPAGADGQITVRVRDSFGNVGVIRQAY
jgi:hypothetical protein